MIDVFKVGVSVAMHTNSAQVLSTMLAQLTGVHIAAGKVQGALGSIRTAALGAGAVFAGWAVVKGLIDATKHAEKLNHELVKLQTGARLTDAQTAAASNLAFTVARSVPGTNVAENVKQQRELFGVFRDMDTAQSLLPMVAQGSRAVGNFVDKDVDLAQIAIRALELRGHITKDHKIDPKEFTTEFNAMVRSIVASEGLVDPSKLFAFIKQAGPAARTMSADTMWGQMPAIMNALNAGPAGTAINSLFGQFVGHVVAGERVAVAMEAAGMLTPGKWGAGKGGKVKMDPDAVPDQAGFMDHPVLWLHEKLEAMRAKKDKNGKPLDEQRIIQEIFQLSSRVTSARLISDIDANYAIIENEKRGFQRTPNPDVIAGEQNDKDLSVNIDNLNEAWTNFMTALGGPGIPIAIGVLHTLTDALNAMQAAIINHRPIAAAMFYLAGGIASLTALGGALVILNVCWAPLAAGLSLLTGVTGLAAVGAGLTAIGGGLSALIAPLVALAGILKFGSDRETPENRRALDDLTHSRGSGLMPEPTEGVSPYVAPPKSAFGATGNGDVYLDGERVGKILNNRTADQLSRSQSGSSNPDIRISPWMPGLIGGY